MKRLWGFKFFKYLFLLIVIFKPLTSFASDAGASDADEVEFAPLSEPDSAWYSNIVFGALSAVVWGVFQLISFVFVFFMKLLNGIISGEVFYDVFFSEDNLAILNISWAAVRDFLNLFFILILVFIAISIILNIPKYNDKKLIFRVILAAVLVNFSKAITLVVIDISQLVMNFFSGAISFLGDDFSNIFSSKIGLSEIFSLSFNNGISFFVVMLMSTIFFFILTSMIVTLATALIIRLVAFWVLLVLSPMAMFGLALPGTSIGMMTDKWMKKLISWAFFGPLMMFFLWLALVVVTATSNVMMTNLFGPPNSNLSNETQDMINNIMKILIPYISGVYLLYYGFDLSRSVSEGAAQSVLDYGKGKIKSFGKGVGGFVASPITSNWKAGKEAFGNRLYEEEPRYLKFGGLTKGIARRMTKKGREDVHKERVDLLSGKASSSERRKINEEKKRFKDENLSNDQLQDILINDDGKASFHTRLAAASHLAKEGKLNSEDLYRSADEVLGQSKDRSVADNLRGEMRGKNGNLQGRADFVRYMTRTNPGTQKTIDEQNTFNERVDGMKIEDLVKLPDNALTHRDVVARLSAAYGRMSRRDNPFNEQFRQGKISNTVDQRLRGSVYR